MPVPTFFLTLFFAAFGFGPPPGAPVEAGGMLVFD
jgi:hypothetical protein